MKRIFFILIVLFVFWFEAFSQFLYRPYYPTNQNNTATEINNIRKSIFRNGVDITQYLPKKCSRLGDIDYTTYIQKGIDQNSVIIMPDFPILINEKGLIISSNKSILFQENSELILRPNNKESYHLLSIDNVSNVKIFFPKLKGDKSKHLSTTGQWGMGIFIRSSKNVTIRGANIREMWGDGIYIGSNGIIPTNILVENSFMDNNRRNGISVISGNNIQIKNTVITNTNGVSPSGGIDIEPNTNNDVLKDIFLDNITTFNNGNYGILLAFDMLVGNKRKDVSIIIRNHKDSYSPYGCAIYVDRNYVYQENKLYGYITIENSVYKNNRKASFYNNPSKKNNINFSLNIKSEHNIISKKNSSDFSYDFKNGKKIEIK